MPTVCGSRPRNTAPKGKGGRRFAEKRERAVDVQPSYEGLDVNKLNFRAANPNGEYQARL